MNMKGSSLKEFKETQIFSPYANMNLQKNPLKETQYPSRYYSSSTNLKFQHEQKYHL